MLTNNDLRFHFVNVNHGDATIVEFPDLAGAPVARFGVVDVGAKKKADRDTAMKYFRRLLEVRRDGDSNFSAVIEFICITHPHDDHYTGLPSFLDEFENHSLVTIREFWDCGFRVNATNYNKLLKRVDQLSSVTFMRMSSGTEFKYGDVRLQILSPSIDLRNRFDTYGIGKNDASIVMKFSLGNSHCILAADAEFASWGKITEEFPRKNSIEYVDDALGLSQREETADQLKCGVLKLAHHGSKHGNTLEYLERLKPNHVIIPAGDQAWYASNLSNWAGKFPHSITDSILSELNVPNIYVLGDVKHTIFTFTGSSNIAAPTHISVDDPDAAGFDGLLAGAL